MRGDVTVYSSKNIICSMGTHIPSGFAEDSFISVTPQGDGVTDEAGADGEVVISIPDDPRFEIKLVLQYGSKTNAWLMKQYNNNKQMPGSGIFNMQVKDLGQNPELYGIQGMGLQAGSHCLRKNSAYSGVDAACCW